MGLRMGQGGKKHFCKLTQQHCSYQISVDEAVGLQVLHAFADIQADGQ